MADERTTCPRCGQEAVELDPVEGILLCTNCGYVLEETSLQHQEYVGDMATTTRVEEAGGAHVAAGGAAAMGHPDAAYKFAWQLRKDVDALKGYASILHLPENVAQEAVDIFKRIKNEMLVYPGGPQGAMSLFAGILYLVVRSNKLPLTILDVAQVTQCDPFRVGSRYREVGNALHMLVPSVNLRSLVVRFTAELLTSSLDAELRGATVRQHPIMVAALQLEGLVTRLGLAEGKNPRTQAAAILLIVLHSPLNKGLGLSPKEGFKATGEVAALMSTGTNAIHQAKNEIVQQLLKLSKALPFAAYINEGNLVTYLGTLASLCSTLAKVKHMQQVTAGGSSGGQLVTPAAAGAIVAAPGTAAITAPAAALPQAGMALLPAPAAPAAAPPAAAPAAQAPPALQHPPGAPEAAVQNMAQQLANILAQHAPPQPPADDQQLRAGQPIPHLQAPQAGGSRQHSKRRDRLLTVNLQRARHMQRLQQLMQEDQQQEDSNSRSSGEAEVAAEHTEHATEAAQAVQAVPAAQAAYTTHTAQAAQAAQAAHTAQAASTGAGPQPAGDAGACASTMTVSEGTTARPISQRCSQSQPPAGRSGRHGACSQKEAQQCSRHP